MSRPLATVYRSRKYSEPPFMDMARPASQPSCMQLCPLDRASLATLRKGKVCLCVDGSAHRSCLLLTRRSRQVNSPICSPGSLYLGDLTGLVETVPPWEIRQGARGTLLRSFLGVKRPPWARVLYIPAGTIYILVWKTLESLPPGDLRHLLGSRTRWGFMVLRLPHNHGACVQYPTGPNSGPLILS